MKENFCIKVIRGELIIIATRYDLSLSNDEEVVQELNDMKYSGLIIFDNLLVNGGSIKSNRFGKILFENGEFNRKSMVLINKEEELPIEITNNSFYKENKNLLENSILSCSEQERILNKN